MGFVTNQTVLEAGDQILQRSHELADLCIRIQQIAAPTMQEEARAVWIEQRWRKAGLGDVYRDDMNNVYARVKASGSRPSSPSLMVSAHTDTVFPADTNLSVHIDKQNGRIFGPGIGDNSTGVAALLALADVLHNLSPPTDIWLVANTGEEGLGDLRGMRAAVDRLENTLGACIVIEGTGLGRVVHRALGSQRLRISVRAPGGHSWSDFGTPSAVHVLVQIAAELTHLRVPSEPRTSFNIGRIEGGRSVNTIAQSAQLDLDMRSQSKEELSALVQEAVSIANRYRTRAWQNRQVKVTLETIGDRPMGSIDADHPLVQAAQEALRDSQLDLLPNMHMSSTDANIPLSRNIPAVCVGITEGGSAHRLQEWIDPQPLPRGVRHLLMLTWWASEWLAGER